MNDKATEELFEDLPFISALLSLHNGGVDGEQEEWDKNECPRPHHIKLALQISLG
jgi:hypothetical protein